MPPVCQQRSALAATFQYVVDSVAFNWVRAAPHDLSRDSATKMNNLNTVVAN